MLWLLIQIPCCILYYKLSYMKKVIFFLSLSLFSNLIFGQTQDTKESLLAKSKKQKTTGWILLGVGSAAIVTGVIIQSGHKDDASFDDATGEAVLIGGGIASSLASIPFFISAGNKKKKAATLAFSKQQILTPLNNVFCLKTQPTFSLKISLGR